MKIKKNFALQEVAGNFVVLPLSTETLNFNGLITLNESGVTLYRMLEGGSTYEDMASALTREYNVSYEQALSDTREFVDVLVAAGCIDEE